MLTQQRALSLPTRHFFCRRPLLFSHRILLLARDGAAFEHPRYDDAQALLEEAATEYGVAYPPPPGVDVYAQRAKREAAAEAKKHAAAAKREEEAKLKKEEEAEPEVLDRR